MTRGIDQPPGGRHVSSKLAWSTIATATFVALEIGAGIYSNSLALIGDALHNFTDTVALLLAFSAIKLERKPATQEMSYGYQRAGILAAFVNAATLVGFTAYIFYQAWRRFRVPEQVDSGWMLVTAAVALALNSAITLWLRTEGSSDVTIRSALVHMFGDALSSAGILVGAVVIQRTGLMLIDPAISVLIGVLILWGSWGILRETVNLLLEGTPREIDPAAVAQDLESLPDVHGVHHLHIWALTPSRPALSCHVQLGDVPLRSTGDILRQMSALLAERYAIAHTTIQFEHAGCSDDDPDCIPVELGSGHENRN